MKVFLSSTYLDLIEYRKAAHEALERIGQEVGRMEIFGARGEEATSVALDQLEKSDLVIGMYAHRYGFIPAGAEVSITEQEYVHAKNKGKPVLCFVVNEDHPWSPKMMEKDAGKIKKLEDFKAKVLKEKVVDFFTTPADLGMKVATSVHNHLARLAEERQAAEEAAHQSGISVTVRDVSGNLIIGDRNTAANSNRQSSIENRKSGSTLPTQPYFFGRAKELEIIASALSHESRTWGALIDGPGGIGKTALAIKAAHDAPAELFKRKIFITAKVRELTAEGEAKLTDFTRPTYLAMLDELGKELGADGLEKLPPDERPNELRLALAGKKALIIFDNLETLPDTEERPERTRLFQFLSRLPEGNKAIVTSRRRTNVDARIVRLDRLARDEALQLIGELAAKYPRLARTSQKEREDLYEITQGNPLFIRWIAAQVGRDGSQCRTIAEACAFIDKAPKGNDPLEYIFGDLLETFTADETKVLAALTYFTLPAKLQWIAEMTDLPKRAAETALEDLTDRSILTSDLPAQTYFLPPLTAKFIRTRRPEAVTQTGDALTNRAYALAMQYGGFTNYEGFPTLDAEWNFVSAALPRLLTGDNNRLQTVCSQLTQFFNFTGRWDEMIWLFEQAEAHAIATGDKENAGWRTWWAGFTYSFRNQPAEVLACAARVTKHWQESTPYNKSSAIRLRGIGHELEKNYPAAIAAYREALEIRRSISPESNEVSIALSDLADAEKANKDYPAAERDYREALRISRKNNNQEHIATRLGNLAGLALDREQWAEAESLAREALALGEKVGRQELIASDCDRLAEALLKQNAVVGAQHAAPLQEALSLSRRAVEIFTRLRSPRLQSAQKTLAEIERSIGA
jgi:tetratricopeptide (TPR) repeat protein